MTLLWLYFIGLGAFALLLVALLAWYEIDAWLRRRLGR